VSAGIESGFGFAESRGKERVPGGVLRATNRRYETKSQAVGFADGGAENVGEPGR